jgi:hypothetical protein
MYCLSLVLFSIEPYNRPPALRGHARDQVHCCCLLGGRESILLSQVHLSARAPIDANTCGCGELVGRDTCGPLLRFNGVNPHENTWNGSALYVTRHGDRHNAPRLSWNTDRHQAEVDAEHLDSFHEWNVWRFELRVPVEDCEQVVSYSVGDRNNRFHIPGASIIGPGAVLACLQGMRDHQAAMQPAHHIPGHHNRSLDLYGWHHQQLNVFAMRYVASGSLPAGPVARRNRKPWPVMHLQA